MADIKINYDLVQDSESYLSDLSQQAELSHIKGGDSELDIQLDQPVIYPPLDDYFYAPAPPIYG